MQFRGIAENDDGESLEFRFTSGDWLGAVQVADSALALEVENDEHLNENGPWIVRAVTLLFGTMAAIADSSQMIVETAERIILH